ncbi:MAG: electron transport complex subunit E [Ruminococcus sp.]|nr:electron transport complex subunit E [Ruminococcus sp.]
MKQMKEKKPFDKTIFDGMFMKNTVLASGLVIAPVVMSATTLANGIAIAVVFSCITFFTIMISSFVPRDMVYAVRIILYTFIASLVYVPVTVIFGPVFETEFNSIGIMIPLLITNSLIVIRSELHFFRLERLRMIAEVIFYIIGFDIVVILVGFIREIFAYGSIGDKIIGIPLTFPALSTTFGGFMLLAVLSAVLKKIKIIVRSNSK